MSMPGYNPRASNRFSQAPSQQVDAITRAIPVGQPVQPFVPAIQTGALFGRPGYTYTATVVPPQSGPTPKQSYGSGLTGAPQSRQRQFAAGGFIEAVEDYQPMGFSQQPAGDDTNMRMLPVSIGVGTDGNKELNPTYNPHDFTPAERFLGALRAARTWLEPTFGPGWRSLLQQQLVKRYNLYNQIAMSRPLQNSDYFLGYQTTIDTAGSLGIQGGPMGSLGYK